MDTFDAPTTASVLDLVRLRASVEDWRGAYASAEPYPHLVIDDLIDPAVMREAQREFMPADDASWTSWVHVNERKYGNTELRSWGPNLQAIGAALMSDPFLRFLEDLTGINGLIPDPTMDGGGLHQSGRGGFLNVHADFTTHHVHQDWRRRINLLLYFNDTWQADYGGELELWDRAMQRSVATVAPVFNRALIFTTDEDSFHGHPDPMTCPTDWARRSMALYYFTLDDAPLTRSTNYRPRPSDSTARRLLIRADRTVLHGYDIVKRRLGVSDETASRWLRRVERLRRRRD